MKDQKNLIVPSHALELCHFDLSRPLSLNVGENTLVAVPEHMTAMEAVNTIGVLTEFTTELITALKDACGTCAEHMKQGGCPFGGLGGPEECPYKDMDGPEVELSDAAREKLGIAPDAKLTLYPDVGEGLVTTADYDHDITDVPESIQFLLTMAGVCPGKLDWLLMDGMEVWHG